MKKIVLGLLGFLYLNAHPVSYTIDLEVKYNEDDKKVKILCSSNSKNKCGLHNFHLVDKNDNILLTKRFPFLKKSTSVNLDKKPYKMVFFLRKVPEHNYITIVE